jgi:hypothetical protein
MGDIDKENSVSDNARLGLKSDGFSDDFFPCAPDGIGFEGKIDLKTLKRFAQNRTDGLRFAHGLLRDPKSEARAKHPEGINPKFETNSNDQITELKTI